MMSATTVTFSQTLTVITCAECSMPFGIPQEFQEQRRKDHGTFYCPRGHTEWYPEKSDLEKQKERAEIAEREARFARNNARFYQDEAAAQRRSAAAYKGHVTRIRNMVARGVCPVPGCRRNFTNVREHMATMHPDYHEHEVTE
jgi:hypothetical protein